MGNFKKNIWIKSGHEETPDSWGTAWWLRFSRDPAQKFMYVADGRNELIHVLDHETETTWDTVGRPGHQVGGMHTRPHIDVDSKGNIYIAETDIGRRLDRQKLVK